MLRLIYSLIIIFAFRLSFSLDHAGYILNSIEISGELDQDTYNFVTNEMIVDFQNNNLLRIDLSPSGIIESKPDFFLTGSVSYYEEKYTIYIKFSDIINPDKILEDEVYTYDLWSREGLKDCIKILADRIMKKLNGRKVMIYREISDYKKIHGRMNKINKNLIPTGAEIINIINVPMSYPYGYLFDFPLAFGFDFFQYGIVWMFPNLPFGFGISTEAFDILGPNAGTVLPLQLLIPIYIFPDKYAYNRKDIYLYSDWGFLLPQYSYLNIGVKIMFNGLSLSFGWLYLPAATSDNYSREEYSGFFGRITISFGKYNVNWK